MIRDLVEIAVDLVREERASEIREKAARHAEAGPPYRSGRTGNGNYRADTNRGPRGQGGGVAMGGSGIGRGVVHLVAALAWLAKRGAFATLRRTGTVTVETAVPLGERRSLVIVAVEGRRLLLGLTPSSVSMVTELGAAATFESQLDSRS